MRTLHTLSFSFECQIKVGNFDFFTGCKENTDRNAEIIAVYFLLHEESKNKKSRFEGVSKTKILRTRTSTEFHFLIANNFTIIKSQIIRTHTSPQLQR